MQGLCIYSGLIAAVVPYASKGAMKEVITLQMVAINFVVLPKVNRGVRAQYLCFTVRR